jgi:SDR family mycofactocin-dependent oxidoreductase
MTGRVQDKVALITGAGRGQGRSHAIRLAEEGARVIAVDLPDDASKDVSRYSPYPMATEADLAETVRLVAAAGGDAIGVHADVRNEDQLAAAVAAGVERFGRLDVVSANAGITGFTGKAWELSRENWQAVIDIDLTGTWQTVKAAAPIMIEQRCGSVVITASTMGVKGTANLAGYVAAKHGVVGLVKALAHELAPFAVRVNAVAPTSVGTDMIFNDAVYRLFRPDLADPGMQDTVPAFTQHNLLPVPWAEARDISEAVLWLASDEARYVHGIVLPVDAGQLAK